MLWIGNGSVVLLNAIISNSSVTVENGVIVAIGEPCPDEAQVLDVHGGFIMPGFIDVHVHGGGGADVMDATPEAVRQMARVHCQHGTTAIVPTTMTCEDELLERVVIAYLEAEKMPQDGAELLGLHLEGPFFSAAGKGAQPIKEQRIPTREKLEHFLRLGNGRILRWDVSPEISGSSLFAQIMREHGVCASVAHTQATAEETLAAFDAGCSHVTHFYNATSTFHKKDGLVHAGVVEATYLRDDVTIELIGDGRHIPKHSMQLAHRIKGAGNICLITDAMRAAGTDVAESILGARDTGVPVVIKDGVAQLTDLSAYAGSICTMDRALRTAHLTYGLPLTDVSCMLSATPARLCGCEDHKGKIAVGYDADLVIVNDAMYVQHVFVNGRQVR